MSSKRILLIGGTGYIGSAIFEILKRIYHVRVTGRHRESYPRDVFRSLDFSDRTSIKKVLTESPYDLIFILAARVEIRDFKDVQFRDPVFSDNVFGLNTLFRYLMKLQPNARLVFVSSMTVYDPKSKSPVREKARLNPPHQYGLSKLFGELIFSYYISHYQHCGVILRLPGVFGGKRKNGYIYNLITQMKKGEDVVLDCSKLAYWESIYIDDFTQIIKEFIEKYPFDKKVEAFNVGYGEETDFISTAYDIRALLRASSNVRVGKKRYRKFYLSNKKISRYINTKKYSYRKALKKYAGRFL